MSEWNDAIEAAAERLLSSARDLQSLATGYRRDEDDDEAAIEEIAAETMREAAETVRLLLR